MLNDLFISKVRVKMLELFMLNPTQMFHVREIVRQVDEEINAVRRELQRMEKGGMVRSEWRANRRYYEFKKEYLFYPELLAMMNKIGGLGGEVIQNRAKLGKVKFAFISGGFARGKTPGPKDVEFLIVGTIVLPELSALVKNEEVKRAREINYTVMAEDEYKYRVTRRDPFILDVLERPRIMLIGEEEALLADV
ncbi:MAG: winged helix-turn-helix domain-containing protein [bacterium]|nr:winged helix-turn-helix domain-containing protein [bacterium]